PSAILLDKGVCELGQLSYERDQDDFHGVSARDYGMVRLSQIRVIMGGDKQGHGERVAQELASAMDEGFAAPLAGWLCYWRKAPLSWRPACGPWC
ncbi:hypothetical protein, partial [Paracoccus sp. (in: a-proteobacteria)]|uniref:hypothetical protein n=1 Tax=Paracoccus sp. TaxID=267 RepID=UPI00396C9B2A